MIDGNVAGAITGDRSSVGTDAGVAGGAVVGAVGDGIGSTEEGSDGAVVVYVSLPSCRSLSLNSKSSSILL